MIDYLINLFTNQTNLIKYYYGWIKDDKWDIQKINNMNNNYSVFYTFTYLNSYDNIKYVDLRNDEIIPVFDQLNLNSSTANAISYCYMYNKYKKTEPIDNPSRLFIYYNQKLLNKNTGFSIFSGLNTIYTFGVCSEKSLEYNINNIPTEENYKEALNNKISSYNAIDQNINHLKAALINNYPILFGFNVYESFHSENTTEYGNVNLPMDDEQLVGNQSAVIVGFDDGDKVFIVRNSWGTNWGDKGYCYMPYEYILNPELASDFWVLRN